MQLYPTPKFVYDRKKQSDRKNPGFIEVQIIFQRKVKFLSTGIKVLPKEWKGNKITGRDDAENLNFKINSLLNHIQDYINSLILRKEPFKWEDFNGFLKGTVKRKDVNPDFIDYIKSKVETKSSLKESTLKNHKKLIGSLIDSDIIKTFDDLTLKNIIKYDEWLHNRDYKQATVASYHKFLKIYINDAIRDELIERNPYVSFKVDRGKSALRKYLTEKELDSLIQSEMPGESFKKVRDLFLFQCYTGLAYADLHKFDFETVIERDGKFIIHDIRQKTGEDFYIVLLSNAVEILKRYNYKLPLLTNQQYNMRLKVVGGSAGLKKDLTTHMGRHTYAALCLNKGVSIEVLAKMLGHSDIKTTQIYAKMFNKTVEDAFEMLEGKITERENK